MKNTQKNNINEKIILSDFLFQVCINVLLGHASIQKNTSKKKLKHRLKFLQSAKNKKYLYYLHYLFNDYVISKPFFNEKRNTYSFQIVFHTNFNKLAIIFLNKQNKKYISNFFVCNKINEISLAYWFMDDGGLLSYNKDYKRKGLVYNTQGFSFVEVQILSKNLNKNYNLQTWIKLNKKKPIICISYHIYYIFKNKIFKYIICSMKYKFPI